jgi:Putative Ig domain
MRVYSMTARPGGSHRLRLAGCVLLICALWLTVAQPGRAQGAALYKQAAVALTLPPNDFNDEWTVNDTACATTDACVVVGGYSTATGVTYPFVTRISDGQPQPAVAVTLPPNASTGTQKAALEGAACQSDETCTAYGYYTDSAGHTQDMIVPIVDEQGPAVAGEVIPPATAAPGTLELLAIGCPPTGVCVAVGDYGDATTHENLPVVVPVAGGMVRFAVTPALPANHDQGTPTATLADVGCQSDGSCTAVGDYDDTSGRSQAMVVQITRYGSHATTAAVAPAADSSTTSPDSLLSRVACPTSGPCEAAGSYTNQAGITHNMVVPTTGGTPGTVTGEITGPTRASPSSPYISFTGMSCSSASLCVASGAYKTSSGGEGPAVLKITGSKASPQAVSLPADQDPSLNAAGLDSADTVSCQPSGPCLAEGHYPLAAHSDAGLLAEISPSGQVQAGQQAPMPVDTATSNPNGPGQYDYLDYGIGCDAAGSCATSGKYWDKAGAWLPYLVTLQAPLSVSTSRLPRARQRAHYSTTLAAAGAWGVYDNWWVSSGSLPDGLDLNSQTGVISGWPSGSGTATFTVNVTGTGSPAPSASRRLSLTVAAVAQPPVLRILGAAGDLRVRKLGVKLSCAQATCSGTVKLDVTKVVNFRHGRKHVRKRVTVALGKGRYSLSPGGRRTFSVKLNAAGRHALTVAKRHHRLELTIVATVVGGKRALRREAIHVPNRH